jgi:hypothetical protein
MRASLYHTRMLDTSPPSAAASEAVDDPATASVLLVLGAVLNVVTARLQLADEARDSDTDVAAAVALPTCGAIVELLYECTDGAQSSIIGYLQTLMPVLCKLTAPGDGTGGTGGGGSDGNLGGAVAQGPRCARRCRRLGCEEK